MLPKEFQRNCIPCGARLRTNAADAAIVDNRAIGDWRCGSFEAQIANGRSGISDVGEVVVGAGFLEQVSGKFKMILFWDIYVESRGSVELIA